MRYHPQDPYLSQLRDSLSVPRRRRSARIKLIGSIAALAVVLAAASFLQFGRAANQPHEASRIEDPNDMVEEPRRTVFGGRPSPVAEAPVDDRVLHADEPAAQHVGRRSRAGSGSAASSLSAAEAGIPQDLQAFLDRWRTTMITGDAIAQASMYAPRVEKFFTKSNVSRQDVRREKERMLARYPEFHKYDIRDVRVESLDDGRAVLTFRKDWDARGRGRFAGSEQQRLTLTKRSGAWQIIGEEETKIYWVRRS